MSVLIVVQHGSGGPWRDRLGELLPGESVRLWPDAGDPEAVEFCISWRHPPGLFRDFPNLRAILSIGAGVDHVFADPDLPDGVPVVRLIDPRLKEDMTLHVVHRVIHYHRGYDRYPAFQAEATWERIAFPDTEKRRVGVMGLGELGAAAAQALAGLGFAVGGWSNAAKGLPGVEDFAGAAALPAFLARTDILVCLLPLTPATADIVDARLLAQLPEGAFVINAARGGHVVEADLIAALDSGRLARANLDVFREEPLPAGSPLWRHPKIDVTPHAAARVNLDTGCRIFAETIAAMKRGESPANAVDPRRGY